MMRFENPVSGLGHICCFIVKMGNFIVKMRKEIDMADYIPRKDGEFNNFFNRAFLKIPSCVIVVAFYSFVMISIP
jgi:hypothetical protein